MGGVVVLTRESAEARVQELLTQAKAVIDEVTSISREYGLEPSFMEMTFRHRIDRWGESYPLREPDWYSDSYWQSSDAQCQVAYLYPGEEEP